MWYGMCPCRSVHRKGALSACRGLTVRFSLAVPLSEMMQGKKGQQMGQMGQQGLSSDYTGFCDSTGANCTTFTGQNGDSLILPLEWCPCRDGSDSSVHPFKQEELHFIP